MPTLRLWKGFHTKQPLKYQLHVLWIVNVVQSTLMLMLHAHPVPGNTQLESWGKTTSFACAQVSSVQVGRIRILTEGQSPKRIFTASVANGYDLRSSGLRVRWPHGRDEGRSRMLLFSLASVPTVSPLPSVAGKSAAECLSLACMTEISNNL